MENNFTVKKYKKFYEHPVIQALAHKRRWSVSTNQKWPVDMVDLIYRHRSGNWIDDEGRKFKAAAYRDERCLVSLPDTLSVIPHPTNHAYFLTALTDGVVILDIEPACPQEIKEHFLKMPYLYAEKSMSGKGYHLIFPYPEDIIEKYPDALNKKVLKSEDNTYEILLNHYITFTRNMLPEADESHTMSFRDLFENLAKEQKEIKRDDFLLDSQLKPEIPHEDKILSYLLAYNMKKKLSDYSGDYSKYEFAWASQLNRKLNVILKASPMRYQEYNKTQRAWLVYTGLQNKLEHRPKHDEYRNDLPWLLFLAQEALAKTK